MTPRRLAEPGVVEKKQEAFNNLRMTTHWAHQATLFPIDSQGNREITITPEDIGKPVLTDMGRRLVGF